MTTLGIDIETYSDINIKNGVYRYVDTDNFRILLFAYQIDNKEVELVDLTKEALPGKVLDLLKDGEVVKTAFNAQFERVCINKYFGLETKNWHCTMIKAWYMGLEGGLANVSEALGVSEDKGKMKAGSRLIRKFSIPQKPTKKRPSTKPYTEEEAPEDWALFKEYCVRDVEVESFIKDKLSFFEIAPEEEKRLYTLDQKINDRGIRLDTDMARNAIAIDSDQTEKYTEIFNEVTGIKRPTMTAQLKDWLSARGKGEVTSITKGNQKELEEQFADDKDALIALHCRYKTSKSSIAKYQMIVDATCQDGRMRGTLQFYGASTGRWAGRLLQVQNLPRNYLKGLDDARWAIKHTDFEFLDMAYKDVSDILRQLIRPTIIPDEGNVFVVSDYSAIEARVVAWLAGEEWALGVFRTTGKIYEAQAGRMLGVPAESIKKGSPERQRGKVATLALGYQGGVGSLVSMGALDMGIPEEELQSVVDQWRDANKNIVSLWYEVERKVKAVISTKGMEQVRDKLTIYWKKGILWIELPSSRSLAYPRAYIGESTKFPGSDQIKYWTGKKWVEIYGGKFVENIVQAIARDCLAHAILRLDEEGYDIVMHVHDEVVIEVPEETAEEGLATIGDIMGEEISWAKGLPLGADGFTCDYYQKD